MHKNVFAIMHKEKNASTHLHIPPFIKKPKYNTKAYICKTIKVLNKKIEKKEKS